MWRNTPVSEEIFQRLPVSLELGLFAVVTSLLIALPVGVYSAIRQDTASDYAGRTLAILAISLPAFWLGTMVIVYPSIWWNWVPPMQYIPFPQNPMGNIMQFLLPGFLMGMVTSGSLMRMTRTMMLEVLRQDYIRTAWAKGLPERTIIVRHALKNALIPVITILGTHLSIMISGTVVIEQIFALPGVGRLVIDALNKRDYPLVSGINMMVSSFVLIMNLVVDLAYGYLDPSVVYK
ncbi:ABC transporter permease [Chloroflexota bacterium]